MDATRLVPRALLGLALISFGSSALASPPYWFRPWTEESHPDVFYNFYVPGNGGTPARAYPAPLPAPAVAGWTYYTYQPLMPHEFMYHHHRTYHQHYDQGRGLNRTKIVWYGTPVRSTFMHFFPFLDLPKPMRHHVLESLPAAVWSH